MLVAICGSQGTGKSTILQNITLQRPGCNVITRKTSRSILSEWNVQLKDVYSSPEIMRSFQDELLKRKLIDDKKIDQKIINFTERSFVDLFVYSLVVMGSNNKYSEWIDNYYSMCCEANKIYDYVFYVNRGVFDVEDDGTRSTNSHFSKLIDQTMLTYSNEMYDAGTKFIKLESTTPDERVTEIINYIYQ